jgi:hypothetical protein
MQKWPKPAEGSWTQHYPELGTGPVSFRDSTSPEFYELEREAVFKRAWLNVARVEELPRVGSYLTKEIDAAKMEKELKESLASVDWEKMNKQMDEVKKIDMSKLAADMKKMEIEMKGLGPKIEKEMENAKASIEKAKVEMREYKTFVDGLEKDGLINKKEGYSIQHKNGELIINGKKQPADVYNKYRIFLKKHEKFTIKKSDDDFNIYNDDDN